jgi:hypothetical protein
VSALVIQNLSLDVSCDFQALVTLTGQTATQVGIEGATAVMSVFATPMDAAPLFQVSTTPGANGSLVFGVGLPAPVGANCTSLAAIEDLGLPLNVSLAPPVPLDSQVASLAALAALDTTLLTVGDIAFVQASTGSWFAWSPSDPGTPNGTTIIASTGPGPVGNWLLAGCLSIAITAAATALIAGNDQAFYDVLVSWANGTTTKLLGGLAFVAQTNTTP